MFKKRKLFKESIKGIYKDWKISEYTVEKDGYSLWIANGRSCFKDYGAKPFLICFKKWERELLWKELQQQYEVTRPKVFKEFKLHGE